MSVASISKGPAHTALGTRTVLLVVLAVVALHAFFAVIGAETDDALITYRYAERLGEGKGFTYNDGERVLGTTTPLWTLVLAGGTVAGVPPDVLTDVLNPAFGGLAAALLIALVSQAWGRVAAVAAATLYATSPMFLRAASYGMETPLFTALLVATLLLIARERWAWAGLVLGLACITRLEGVLLGGAVVLLNVRRPRALARLVVCAALVVAPWVVFAFQYFGSPIPHSLQAKLVHAYRPRVAATAHFLLWGSPYRLVLSVAGALGALALVRALRRPGGGAPEVRMAAARRALGAGALFALAYIAFYLAGHPVPYEWYLPPLQMALLPLAGITVAEAAGIAAALGARRFARSGDDRLWLRATFDRAALGLLMMVGLVVLVPRTISQTQIWRERVDASFVALVEWLDGRAPENARIFAGDIGYLGYRTKRPILDASALVSPEVLAVRRAGGHPNDLIARELPEVLVFPVQPGVYPIRWPDVATEERYRAAARFPAGRPLEMTADEARDWFRLQGGWKPDYVVYMRRDLP